MKTLITLFLTTVLLLNFQKAFSQSFEETNFIDLTTTPSASRSVNFIDINGDGWDDIFVSNGLASGQNNMLYINDTNGGFNTITSDDIVNDHERSDGCSFADVDNDGDLDAIMVTFGAGGVGRHNYFYRNNGDGSFNHEPEIAMGVELTYSETATWVDVNNDQYLDLYVTNSVGNLNNLYYENQGDGSFLNITNLSITAEGYPTRSVDWVDYDNDGDSDLFVTNEENSKNTLYRNDGPGNFIKITNLAIAQGFKSSAGSSWGDIDNDGDFDLFVANWGQQSNQLFINDGGVFTENTNSIISEPVTNSFGSTFGDIDNDGDLDLFVCNAYLASQNKNFVYINDGNGNFSEDTSSDLANQTGYTFGAAFGDYDNDGWLDIFLANTSNENQTNSLYHNTGTGNNWVKILCEGTTSNSSAVGAIVKVKAIINGNSVLQTRKVVASSGYCSQNSYATHFGLGNATIIDEIEVTWPSGAIEIFTEKEVNGRYKIVEGDGITLGVNEIRFQNKIISYPSPAKDYITVEAKFSTSYAGLIFNIYDLNGRVLKTIDNIETIGQNLKLMVDLSLLTTGFYVYTIDHKGEQLINGKIIKE